MKHPLSSFVWFFLVLVAVAPNKVVATTIDYISSTISEVGVDQDPNRDGIQLRYDWAVHNASYQNNSSDAIWQYTIQADLEEIGMYGFTNYLSSHAGAPWSFVSGLECYFTVEGVLDTPLILPGAERYFSAFVDEILILGNQQAASYGLSNEGQTNIENVQVPITRGMTSGNGTTFGWLKDHNLVTDTNSTASYAEAALVDTDSDGFANWQEYITDTDPNSSNSFFRITISDSALSWHSATGRVYTVKGAVSLTNSFSEVTNFTGVAGTLSYTNAGTDGFRFYRLEAELAP